MTAVLSYKAKQAIDKWLTKFPADQKQSALLFALRIVQEENQGWLSEPLMEAVAAYLSISKATVFEVATFYSMFELNPVGKHKIAICTSVSCMLCGSDKMVKHFKNRLQIGVGETTPDGKFTLKEVECLAACNGAPLMQINKTLYEKLTPEKIDDILKELEKSE